MRHLTFIVTAFAVACFSFSLSGCDQTAAPEKTATSTDDHGHDHDGEGHEDHESHEGHDEDAEGHEDHDDHGHGSHAAPHGGQVIELGRDHLYHAEMTDDHDTESITIYMLDGKMEDLKIDAASISLTLISGDDAKTFELASATKEGDGGSSFSIEDEAAFDLLESEGTEGKLRVEIDGKPLTGSFAHHEHDH